MLGCLVVAVGIVIVEVEVDVVVVVAAVVAEVEVVVDVAAVFDDEDVTEEVAVPLSVVVGVGIVHPTMPKMNDAASRQLLAHFLKFIQKIFLFIF